MPVEQYDLVVFLGVDWGATTSKNRQHFLIAEVARQLDSRSKVLAIERPICPWTTPFRKREKIMQLLCGEHRLRRAGPNLYVYIPFVFVHNLIAAHIPGMTALNRRLLMTLLRRVLTSLKFRARNLITWIYHPYQLEDIGLMGEKTLVYDCYDNYTASEPNPTRRRDLMERERAILRRADCVFVSSEELLRAKRGSNRNVHLIPNGVEFEHFTQAARKDETLQNDGPVLGFTGKITPRLDFRLLVQLAATHPHWKLVMIGPKEREDELVKNPDYRAFVSAPNVYLPGSKLYEELPVHMQAFDVCLLPYKADDPFNIHCSPLKLYEYLATGKPIVSTDLPAARSFKAVVRVAQDAEEFEGKITESLVERDGKLSQQRQAAAHNNSWERRAEGVLEIIGANLERSGP